MKTMMIEYKVKRDRVAENEKLVADVYQQLKEKNLQGVHYSTHLLEDGVSFIHLASFESADANDTFSSLSAFKKFQAGIKDRCDELPTATEAVEIGVYLPQSEG